METSKYRLGYRSDIEGLRAVAILLVVGAHAHMPGLAGGFVGVDVFFVLSGYLITGLLTREIATTGRLKFADFYARRLRRLLPALVLVLAITSLVAVVALPPGEQGRQATGAATAALWISNIHFAFAHLDYFSPDASSNLFLHTWSLGVEEQFYLIWPALMLWVFRARRSKSGNSRRMKVAMLTVGIASLVGCILLTRSAPQMAFYLMPLRAWQFAAGALVWLYFGPDLQGQPSSWTASLGTFARHLIGWSGLGLIVVASLWFNESTAYPGWRAMLPAIGTVGVLVAGANGSASGVSALLSLRPMQAIGRISYSWYLWHWPVLLLGAELYALDSGFYRTGLAVLSLLLAMASYIWVESPIRHQSRWVVRPGVTILSALGLMVAANAACIEWFNTADAWKNSPVQQRYQQAHVDAPVIYSMGCDDWYHSDRVRLCTFGPAKAKHTAVLMGDSIGAQWFSALAIIFNRPDWRLLVVTKSSCPMVDEPFFYTRIGRDYVECTNWRKQALLRIASIKPDVVILGSVQSPGFSQDQWIDGTARILSPLSASSGQVYLLRGTPHLPFDGPNCLAAQNWLPWLHMRKDHCNWPAFNAHDDEVYHWLQQASARFNNVTAIDMNPIICRNGECRAQREGAVVFRDSQHLTASFMQSLAPVLGKKLGFEVLSSRTPSVETSEPIN